MPANGRYNRQGLNQSRQLLAPIQVAPPKSTIAPTRYISRRSSETASEVPNTATAASSPRPSEPNLNFYLPRSARVCFIIALWIRMRVRVRLDSKFSKSRIEGLPEMSSGAASRNAEQVWNLERGAQKRGNARRFKMLWSV
jgi:hypothetical protein